MRKKGRLWRKAIVWLLCVAMVITTINLPAYVTVVHAIDEGGLEENEVTVCVDDVTYSLDEETKTASVKKCDINYIGDVVIPDSIQVDDDIYSITSIGSSAFNNCGGVKSVEIPEGVISIGSSAFMDCSRMERVVIPESVKNIDNFAFYGCYKLSDVDLPSGLDSLGTSVFYNCVKIDNITIPAGVDELEYGVFFNCESLKNITIKNGPKSIGNSAFFGCKKLNNITLPASVTSIGNDAFYACRSLEKVTFNRADIGSSAFEECDNLKTIEGTLAKVYKGAFKNCTGLETVTVSGNGATIVQEAFMGCTNLKTAIIGEGTEAIGARAFSSCNSLESVWVAGTVKSIGVSAFNSCYNLSDVVISEGVEMIDSNAFYFCKSLKSIEIPASVKAINNDVFWACDSLNRVVIKGNDVIYGMNGPFSLCPDLEIIVPDEYYEEVKNEGLQYYSNYLVKESEAVDHEWVYAYIEGEGKHIAYCKKCTYSKEYTCFGGVANCVQGAHCVRCNSVRSGIDSNNHIGHYDYKNIKKATCTEEGYTGDQYCNNCGKEFSTGEVISKKEHRVKTDKKIPATCLKDGISEGKYCLDCGLVIAEDKVIKATGHTWDEGVVTVQATTENVGEKLFTCVDCGETAIEEIPVLQPEKDKTEEEKKEEEKEAEKEETKTEENKPVTPSPEPAKPTPSPEPAPAPAPEKPANPEISVKGKIDLAALIGSKVINTENTSKKIAAYAITGGSKSLASISKKGILTAKKPGELQITAYADKKKKEVIDVVTVVIKDTKIKSKDTIKYLNMAYDLKSTLENIPSGMDAVFSIPKSMQKYATVDPRTGVVTPIKDGKVKITCEIGKGISAVKFYTTLTIKTPKFDTSSDVKVTLNKTKTIAIKNVSGDAQVIWTVSDDSKAQIIYGSNKTKIKIKGLSKGKVELTATINGCKITKTIIIK